MITRTFHPIGQGAFYSERIGDKTIVYDCGVWNKKEDLLRAEKIVNAAFHAKQPIFIMFISHFDFDHVSQIHHLIKKYKVEKIVMPLLDADEKLLITNYLTVNGLTEIAQLVSDPDAFANQNELSIYQVDSGAPPDEPANIVDRPTTDLDQNNRGVKSLKSGNQITAQKSLGLDWVWIPYNYKSISRAPELIQKLQLAGIDTTKLNDAVYVQLNQEKIKSAYNSIEGNINQNSMFLYSGPNKTNTLNLKIDFIDPFYFQWWMRRLNPACVYTGDGDLNKVNIFNVYKDLWNFVGTIQIPHHGSKKDFDPKVFEDGRFFCPISFGDSNSYGHPAGYVLQSLLENKNYPILINDKAGSIWTQHWS